LVKKAPSLLKARSFGKIDIYILLAKSGDLEERVKIYANFILLVNFLHKEIQDVNYSNIVFLT
jgi:hypothetical protein